MKKAFFLLILTMTLLYSCGNRQPNVNEGEDMIGNTYYNLPGDSTRYGMACDGCTDSILVFMPMSCDRLDTFDIITARQQRHIFGRPHIGDELAIIVNPEDTLEVLTIINLDALRNTWAYLAYPKLRNIDKMTQRMQRHMMERIPDSLKKQWLKPREYSLRLKRDHTAMALGGVHHQTTTDDMSPVEFPPIKRYTEWYIYNGRLILKADTIAGFTQEGNKPTIDTVEIKMLRKDTLVLRFQDHEQAFYRKEQ
jgi:hypothetical protein